MLTPDFRIELDPSRAGVPPNISLDGRYKFVDGMDTITPGGAPSLLNCKKLTITGPVVSARGANGLHLTAAGVHHLHALDRVQTGPARGPVRPAGFSGWGVSQEMRLFGAEPAWLVEAKFWARGSLQRTP